MSQPSVALLRATLGRPHDSPEVAALRALMRGDLDVQTMPGVLFYWCWPRSGLDARFDEGGVTTAIFLYTAGADGHQQYEGEMPEGLRLTHCRCDVENALGRPPITGGDGVIPFWARYPEKGLQVHYASESTSDLRNRIHHVTVEAAEP
jgi:hypothetical protein